MVGRNRMGKGGKKEKGEGNENNAVYTVHCKETRYRYSEYPLQ